MGQKAYLLPVETEAERGPWIPCLPSQIMAGDLFRVRELVPLDKGSEKTEPRKETLNLNGHVRSVFKQVVRTTVFRARRVTEELAHGSPVSIHIMTTSMPLPKQDVFRVYRNPKPNHLKDFARHRDEGPADRTVDIVQHSIEANCQRFLELIAEAKAVDVDINQLLGVIAQTNETHRYGATMPDDELAISWLQGKSKPPAWVWKLFREVVADPSKVILW